MSVDRWEDKENVVNICKMEYYSVIKRNKILTCAATWMDFGNIMLNETSLT